jgi:hypothetical protein
MHLILRVPLYCGIPLYLVFPSSFTLTLSILSTPLLSLPLTKIPFLFSQPFDPCSPAFGFTAFLAAFLTTGSLFPIISFFFVTNCDYLSSLLSTCAVIAVTWWIFLVIISSPAATARLPSITTHRLPRHLHPLHYGRLYAPLL